MSSTTIGRDNGSGAQHRLSPRGLARGAAIALLTLLLLAVGCATTGATLGSGVGDRLLDAPPYYAGNQSLSGASEIAHFAISYQRGAEQPDFLERDGAHGPMAPLLSEMNAFLNDLRSSAALGAEMEVGSVAPDVRFGCERDVFGDCAMEEEGEGVGKRWMTLSVGRPSAAWTRSAAAALEGAERSFLLVVTLEIGEYWPVQKNFRGDKEVRLGAGNAQPLPWLTSLDQPVQVIQLTGALIDREGKAVRIGAEGLLARPTNVVASGFGAQELITAEDIEKLCTIRRHDLTGKPLAWQVALENLVRQLTGQGVIR